jgi:general nucleoside transport system permease protein
MRGAEAPVAKPPPRGVPWRAALNAVAIPVLALFSALVLSAIFILGSDPAILGAWSRFFSDPGGALSISWQAVADAYGALFLGAIGNPAQMADAVRLYVTTGQTQALVTAFWPFTESLVTSTPYIFAGLAVAVGFKCNLFNIGAEGQIFIGALVAAFVGYSVTGLPWIIHMPLTFISAALAGAVWGGIPGWLKAKTGAHEVINTMMMNYVAFRLSDYLLNGPMKRGGEAGFIPISRDILDSAVFPQFFPSPIRLHLGFFVALLMAALVWWFLWKTTLGFEIRTVGGNPRAARYAGISVSRSYIMALGVSGALAAMAGAGEVMGVNRNVASSFSPGYGFDSIALALMGGSHPLGVVLSALLFGALRSGATKMQSLAGVPIDIISIVQAFVIMFVAAPAIIRWIYHVKTEGFGQEFLMRGWGG